jgi:NADH:ubiquinone oxidoreductase subunit K
LTANLSLLIELPLFHQTRVVQVAMFIIGVAGATTERVQVHQTIAAAIWIGAAAAVVLNFSSNALAG